MNIIGCGTGRCGTVSFKDLMLKNGIECTHEKRPLLPWRVDDKLLQERTKYFNDNPNIGDVAFCYLPYLGDLLNSVDDLKVVCLKRDREETVESYMKKTSGRNHWLNHNGTRWEKDPVWDKCYPKYKLPTKREAIREYWNEYYRGAENLASLYPDRVKIYPIDVLNDKETQREMFKFLGIDQPTIEVGDIKNKGI